MTRKGSWRIVQTAVAIAVFLFFLYSVVDAQSGPGLLRPLPLFVVLWATLLPFRAEKGYGLLVGTAASITFVHVLATTGTLLAPFVLAVALAYVLDPLVDRLERRRVPRVAAILTLTLPAIAVLGLVLAVILPSAIRQVGGILQEAPALLENIREGLAGMLANRDVPLLDEAELLTRLDSIDEAAVTAFLAERQEALLAWLWTGVLGLGRGLGTLFTLAGFAALTPVLTFYILRDWDRLTAFAAGLFPADRRSGAVAFAGECDRIVSRYMRSQLLVASIMGLLTGLGLFAFGFPHAATLGVLVAVFSVVPYIGLVLSLVPAVIIALTADSVGSSLLIVAGVYGGTQILESTVIGPRIASGSVGLHPVWVVLAIATGGFFFGFVGLLLAVPAAAVVRLVLVRAVDRYRGSNLYLGAGPESEARG